MTFPSESRRGVNMAKKEERFEVIFKDGSMLKDEGIRQILVENTECPIPKMDYTRGHFKRGVK